MSSACVIGLGLIGGSIAKRLLADGMTVAGFDADPATVSAARAAGIHAHAGGLERLPADCDICIVALPVLSIPPVLEALASTNCQLIMDVASTKRTVQLAAEHAGIGPRFVGCHPFAGSHHCGFDAADGNLFTNARVFLCPTSFTAPATLAAANAFWQSLGADPLIMDAADHDRELAVTSHLPQIAASTLANVLQSLALEPALLGPGGRSMTRLAGSSPAIWTDVLFTNADNLAQPIGNLIAGLNEMLVALEQRDAQRVYNVLESARQWAEPATSRLSTYTEPYPQHASP